MKPTARNTNIGSTSKAGPFASLRGLLSGKASGLSKSKSISAKQVRDFIPAGLFVGRKECLDPASLALCVAAAVSTLLLCVVLVPAPALALPEGRVYEQVSPTYKGGYAANNVEAVAENGESVVFESLGAFAGAPLSEPARNLYLARRGASGWVTSPLDTPAALAPNSEAVAFSGNLESDLFRSKPGPNFGAAGYSTTVEEFLEHQTDTPDIPSDWKVQGEVLEYLDNSAGGNIGFEGASPGFSHLLFVGGTEGENFLAAAVGSNYPQLYDLVARGEGAPDLRLVGVDNHGQGEVIDPYCRMYLGVEGSGSSGPNNTFNAIAADGGEIFFTTHLEPQERFACKSPEQLFVRVGGSRTLEISRPLESGKPFGGCEKGGVAGEVPCSGAAARAKAQFDGASEDGSRVFFTTAAPLVGEDRDSTNDLYMASIGCPAGVGEACATAGEAANTTVESLVRLSYDPNGGEAADVQGVVRVAPDGSRVYFVARGVLTGAPSTNAQGYGAHGEAVGSGAVAQPDADNLYVYDTETKAIAFIADLCSAPGLSGEMSDDACSLDLGQNENDTSLWLSESESQTAGRDGGFLVLSSYGRLVANDTDDAKDVYRYDAETGALVRVSIGEDGADANGNNSVFDATISNEKFLKAGGVDSRVVSEDGSRIVFTSAEPLSAQAVNHLSNVYEWQIEPGWSEGRVSLVSTGSATEPIEHATISSSGDDIFFTTAQGLVPRDTDGVADVYDARLGGGFSPAEAGQEECSGDACQGPLTNPVPLLVPGSVSQAPGQNFTAPTPVTATPKQKAIAKCVKGKRRRHDKCVLVKPKKKKQRAQSKKAGNNPKGES